MARITGNVQPTIALAEHDDTGGVNTKKALMYGWDSSGLTKVRLSADANGYLNTNVTLSTGDIEIGAVEIKNSTDDTRATVGANGLYVDVRSMPTTTVTATDLDIRDLTSVSDSVEVKQATGTNLHSVIDSGTITTITNPVAVTGTFWQATQPVSGTFWQATQPVSGTVTANAGTGTLDTKSVAVVSAANSSTALLGSSATFTGTSVDMLDYNTVRVSVFADQDSAANGLQVQFSNDNTNWRFNRTVTYTANTGAYVVFNRVARYMRVVYTNGSDAQGTFDLQTVLAPNSSEFARHWVGESIHDTNGAIITQSVITAKNPAGVYAGINRTTGGNLKVAIEESDIAAASGLFVRLTDGTDTALVTAGGLLQVDASGATVPVSGTFWQATQPVSIASMPTTAVTGTFFPVAPTRFADLGANATLNVKASAGSVYSLWCQNENASDRYVQLHNTATVPAGAAVPLYTFLISGGDQIVIGTDFFTQAGASFSTGIAFAFSTTKDTYTAGTATEHSTIIHYA